MELSLHLSKIEEGGLFCLTQEISQPTLQKAIKHQNYLAIEVSDMKVSQNEKLNKIDKWKEKEKKETTTPGTSTYPHIGIANGGC